MQELEDELSAVRHELAHAQEIAARASSTWDKFRKERDFHRMHHKRVAQEKNRLITDIKRLKVSGRPLLDCSWLLNDADNPYAALLLRPEQSTVVHVTHDLHRGHYL